MVEQGVREWDCTRESPERFQIYKGVARGGASPWGTASYSLNVGASSEKRMMLLDTYVNTLVEVRYETSTSVCLCR